MRAAEDDESANAVLPQPRTNTVPKVTTERVNLVFISFLSLDERFTLINLDCPGTAALSALAASGPVDSSRAGFIPPVKTASPAGFRANLEPGERPDGTFETTGGTEATSCAARRSGVVT